jgi:hypothetical protein
MALVIDEIAATRLANIELVKENQLYRTKVNFERSYYVLTDHLGETEADVVIAVGIPQIGSTLLGAICKSHAPKALEQVKNPITGFDAELYEVRCAFNNDTDQNAGDEKDTPPESRTPKTSWGGELEDELLEKDAQTGAPIQTAAYERLLITGPRAYPILTIKRYGLFPFDPDVILQYVGKYNSTTFWGAPPGTALMLPISVEETTIEGQKYTDETYQIKFNMKENPESPGSFLQDTWKTGVPHQGHQYLEEEESSGPTTYVQKRAVDDNDKPIIVNLNSDGTRKDAGEEGEYIFFWRSTKVNFNNLNLGPYS